MRLSWGDAHVQSLIRLALVLVISASSIAFAQDERFDIQRFDVTGNTLLAPAQVEALVAPFLGPKRNYGDIQKALETLEAAYRAAGYGTVQVYVPEQELTHGVVRLEITEGAIGKIGIVGNKHFDDNNIRTSLPSLAVGKPPNMRQISEDIQLANENPAKQVEVTLGVSEEEGKVDAKVNVTDEKPQKVIVSVDNTGTGTTGKLRAGVAYQNANVGNRDQVMTLAYTTSPDAPQGVKVDIYSFAYRLPLYSIGDSIDVIYGKSSVNTPMTTAGLGGATLNGKGDVFGLRWNHYFARRGEYTSKLIFGFDDKYMNTRCTNPATGADYAVDPPIVIQASCTPYTVRPLSLTYTGQRQSPGRILDYSLGFYQNLATGSRYAFTTADGTTGTDRYSALSSDGNSSFQRATPDSFSYLKLTFSYLRAFAGDWALRGAFSGQYSRTPLPASEQFGIAGSTAVRGFNERAVAMDNGYFVNLEVYTPELAQRVGLKTGSLKAVGFYDFGSGFNYLESRNASLGQGPFEKAGIGSIGAGLRYAMGKDVSLRVDLARVVDAGPADIAPSPANTSTANTESKGDWRGHFGLQLAF
jgi:hemolysin activation/secretion protein